MKKLAVLAVAVIVAVGAGSIAFAAPNTVKATSKLNVSVAISGIGPYQTATFPGKVKAKKSAPLAARRACKKRRTVKIAGLGKTTTSKQGRFSITVAKPPAGSYEVKAKKKVKKGDPRIVCKHKKKNVAVT